MHGSFFAIIFLTHSKEHQSVSHRKKEKCNWPNSVASLQSRGLIHYAGAPDSTPLLTFPLQFVRDPCTAASLWLLALSPGLSYRPASSPSRPSIPLPRRGCLSADPVQSGNKSCHSPYLETTESQPVFIQRLSDLSFRSWGEKAWMIGTRGKTLNSLWAYNKELRQLSMIRYARVRCFFLDFFFFEAFFSPFRHFSMFSPVVSFL